MIVQCDSCSSKYRIAEEKILPQGIKVRCAKCKNVFVVKLPAPEPSKSPALDPQLPSEIPSPDDTPDLREPSASAVEDNKGPGPAEEPLPEPDAPVPPVVSPPESGAPGGESSDDSDIDDALSSLIGEPGEESFVPATPEFGTPAGGSEGDKPVEEPPIPAPPDHDEDVPGELSPPDKPDPGPESHPALDEPGLTPLRGLGSEPEPPGVDVQTDQQSATQTPGSMDWGNISLDQSEPVEDDSGTLGITTPAPDLLPDDPDDPDKGEEEPANYVEPSTKVRKKPDAKPSSPRKSSKGLRLFLLLVLLLAAGYYNYPSIKALIPSRSAEIAENMAVENITVGTLKRSDGAILATIRGRVTNGFSVNKGIIKVQAIFKREDGQELAKIESFCGNLFTDVELGELGLPEIRSAMNNELGQSLSNASIPPGGSIPFLMVMENPPLDSKEVTVKVLEFTNTP